MVCWLPRTFQLQAILSQLHITPGTGKNKLLSVRAKQALICARCSGAAFLLASGGVTLGIWGWNVFGMRQEVRSTQCEKNTAGSFLIVAQTACPHLSVSLPRLCLLPSLSVSQIKNQPCSHNSQKLQLSFRKKKKKKKKTVPEDEISTSWLCPFCSLSSYRATKVKLVWSLRPTCTTARSPQGECVCWRHPKPQFDSFLFIRTSTHGTHWRLLNWVEKHFGLKCNSLNISNVFKAY